MHLVFLREHAASNIITLPAYDAVIPCRASLGGACHVAGLVHNHIIWNGIEGRNIHRYARICAPTCPELIVLVVTPPKDIGAVVDIMYG